MAQPIALVTGGARGIGAASARLLAARGYQVCVNYQGAAAAAEAVVADITAGGGQALAVRADISQPEQVTRLFETLDAALGRLDVLVNNAGIVGPRCRIDELSVDDLRRVLDVNVVGVFLCAQAAIRRMSTRHGGRGGAIVNLSSGSAYIGNPGSGVQYAMSKGAVNSFNAGASQELVGEGIRVNNVSPGLTATDMTTDQLAAREPGLPMGRAASAEEIAEAVVWLASDAARYVAGANIRVAGGRP